MLTAQDFSGKALIFRHRRRQLVFTISCIKANLIELQLVSSPLMTADSLTKDCGPLEHWRQITHSMGEHPSIALIQEIIFKRYGHKKQLALEEVTTPSTTTSPTTLSTSTPTTPPTTTVNYSSYMSTTRYNQFPSSSTHKVKGTNAKVHSRIKYLNRPKITNNIT